MILTRWYVHPGVFCALFGLAACLGCSGGYSSSGEMTAFTKAYMPTKVDMAKVADAVPPAGPYKPGPGDVLSVQIDDVVRPVDVVDPNMPNQQQAQAPLVCRVDSAGAITLPLVGPINVQGKTVSEIEKQIVASYHPRYLNHSPGVLVKVAEYEATSISVLGAVATPGTFELRRDEMSLAGALTKAGGILNTGACSVRIRNGDGSGERKISIPARGSNTAYADTPLKKGDMVQVDALEAQYFTVTGLVVKPGAYPYPPGEEYNLAQAVGFAGGLNEFAPDRVLVYRKDGDGKVLIARVQLTGNEPTSAINIPVKPGDMVAVEHTSWTSVKAFFARIFHMGVGVGANYDMAGGGAAVP